MLSKSEVFFLTREMQAVPAGWSTSALACCIPGRRGAHQCPGKPAVGCSARVYDSSTFTTSQAVQVKRTSLDLSAGEALLYLP